MLQKFCSVLHQANKLDEVTGQRQVTSYIVTRLSDCIYKVDKKIIVGHPGKLIFSSKRKVPAKSQWSIYVKQILALC